MNIKFFAPKNIELMTPIRNGSRLKAKEIETIIRGSHKNGEVIDNFTYYISDDGDVYPIVYNDSLSSYGNNWDYLIPVYNYCRYFIPKTMKSKYSIFVLQEHKCILVYSKDSLIEYINEIDSIEEMEKILQEERSSLTAKGASEVKIYSDIKMINFDTEVITYIVPEGIKKFKKNDLAKAKTIVDKVFSKFNFKFDISFSLLIELFIKYISSFLFVMLSIIVMYQQYQMSSFDKNINTKLESVFSELDKSIDNSLVKMNNPIQSMKDASELVKNRLDNNVQAFSDTTERVKQLERKLDILIRLSLNDSEKETMIKNMAKIDSIDSKIDTIAQNGSSSGVSPDLEEKLNSLRDDLKNISTNSGSREDKFKMLLKTNSYALIQINDEKVRFNKGDKKEMGSKVYSFDFDKKLMTITENGKNKNYTITE
jgi:hypothetical protein